MEVIAYIGVATVLLGALIALRQDDIKKILAYSTVSQLGYMFVGVGVGAFAEGIFHLVTHAFFKALLFLGAGSVMHAMANRTDVWGMGGLRKAMPITFVTSAVATAAIAGVPPLSGFFSKDQILTEAYMHGYFGIWLLGLLGAVLTAFYMSRWFFLIFLGKPRFGHDVHPHESPASMTMPLIVLAGLLQPFQGPDKLRVLRERKITSFAMELVPRISRAQSMDVLSSQAACAGYKAALIAATELDRFLPMLTTAAGTIRPAKVLVIGAGVAGLQAIATARRLGAQVEGFDVRSATREQVESLGAKFIMTDTLKDASGTGGYARELTKDEQAAQAELVAGHIAKQDIVITTALIPGRPAPRLVTRAMVESMVPGSVIVDLAAERGGNVELTEPGKVVVHKDVTIIGTLNLAGKIAATASQLYAKNLLAFFETMVDKDKKSIAVNMDDELVKATMLTSGGAVVHPNFAGDTHVAKPAAKKPAAVKAAKPAMAKAEAPAKTGAASKSDAAKKPAAKAADKPVAEAPVKTGAASKSGKPAAAKPAAIVAGSMVLVVIYFTHAHPLFWAGRTMITRQISSEA
jgi:NAD(P) transhydrogenase subunit alpha